ncbi:hypothetical protein HDU99_009978, partial [Rhizoclosmatium hyalinum]
MKAFLVRGKGVTPNFAPTPEQVAQNAAAAKKRAAFEFFTEKLNLPTAVLVGRPTKDYLEKVAKRGKYMALDGPQTVAEWYTEQDLPALPPATFASKLTENSEPKTYYSKDPSVQKLYDKKWHFWAGDGSHIGFKTIDQWITDIQVVYNITVAHSTAGEYRKKYITLYNECR